MTDSQGQSTRAIHGSSIKDAHGAPHLPTYNTTTFAFATTEELLDVVEGRKAGALYTRYGLNPTTFALEETMAAVEGAEAALAFCSGMAAEAAVFAQYGRDGIVCLGDAYGGTLELLADQLPLLGIHTTFLLGSELDQLEAALTAGARLVFSKPRPTRHWRSSTSPRSPTWPTATAPWSRWTTPSPHPSTSSRSHSVPTSWSTPPPSTSAGTLM